MYLLKYFYKYTHKNKYIQIKEKIKEEKRLKLFDKEFIIHLEKIGSNILNKTELNLKHSGHLGDIIYSFPVLEKLSHTHKINLFINLNKKIDIYSYKHTAGNVYMNEKLYSKFVPLLQNVNFLNSFSVYNNEKIDIDLDLFRKFPFNLNFISVRWYSHLTSIFPDFSKISLNIKPHETIVNKVVIIRSFRARNVFINYSFLKNYDNLLFLGLPDEYDDLKKDISNLEYYNPKDFYELAQIIKASKFYLGNQSFGFALAECMKVPRLLEAFSDFPVVHPIGENAYDFYFQNHLEDLFKKLYSKS